MKKRLPGASLLALTALVLTAGWVCRENLGLVPGVPHASIEVARVVDLGEHEVLTTVEHALVVRNKGRQPLVLDEVTCSCGCLGLFLSDGSSGREKVERCEVAPRQESTLYLRVAVSQRPGMPEQRTVRFRTNDPNNAEVTIAVSVTPVARYLAAPASVVLGAVPYGERVERDVEIVAFDRQLPPLDRVTSSNPHVGVEYRPLEAPVPASSEGKPAEVVGRLRIAFKAPDTPGEVEAVVLAYCQGREHPVVIVPVSGRAAPLVELTPRQLNLPRSSSSGAVYVTSCLCRTALPKPLRVVVGNVSPDLIIQVRDVPDNPSLKFIHIDASGLVGCIPKDGLVLRDDLTAEIDGRRVPLTLTVSIRPR